MVLEAGMELKKVEHPAGDQLISSVGRSSFGWCSIQLHIPKQITESNEKYVLRCLEMIHRFAVGGTELRSVLADSRSKIHDMTGDDSVITDSRMAKILRTPLLKQLGNGDPAPVHPASLFSGGPQMQKFGPSSSANSIFSASSSGSSASSVQGTVQCTWKDGLPHHIFRDEDGREVYTANASMDKALDCVYTFYGREKMETVATMRVSTSRRDEIRETKFILYASSGDHTEEGNRNSTSKSKRLTRKIASVLFSKQRSVASALEDFVSEDSEETQCHEIAAIVLREICHDPAVVETGGWGLKFLKNTRNNNGGCSTSMNALIPAGLHGGTAPSSLVERWVSEGGCDCGGWDIGCPLTVVAPKQSIPDFSSPEPLHLFIQGSRQDWPALKMENIGEGLYSMHFQSPLSSLQCFAIGAALIHSRNQRLVCS